MKPQCQRFAFDGRYVHWTDRWTADSSREHTGEGQETGEGNRRERDRTEGHKVT